MIGVCNANRKISKVINGIDLALSLNANQYDIVRTINFAMPAAAKNEKFFCF